MSFRIFGNRGRRVVNMNAEPLSFEEWCKRGEEEAIKAGYLSRRMHVDHMYERIPMPGKTFCFVCWEQKQGGLEPNMWFTHGSEKCSCSLLEDELNRCEAERKEQSREKYVWSIGAKPGKIVWQPYTVTYRDYN